jgi:hypothetical protein
MAVNQRKSALAAFALTVGLAGPCTAQQPPVPAQTTASEACAEYFGCLHYGTLTEAQARTARGHPEFVEAPSETPSQAGAIADRVTQLPRVRAVARQ